MGACYSCTKIKK